MAKKPAKKRAAKPAAPKKAIAQISVNDVVSERAAEVIEAEHRSLRNANFGF